jgi:hypothetical protein
LQLLPGELDRPVERVRVEYGDGADEALGVVGLDDAVLRFVVDGESGDTHGPSLPSERSETVIR